MRRHLNTLYVTTTNSWLYKEGENVVVKVDGAERARFPFHLLGGIVCFGTLGATPSLMGYCAKQGICVSFVDRNGNFLARVEGPTSGNVLLRRAQYRAADDPERSGSIASHLITGKVNNQRTVVRRALRDCGDRLDVNAVAELNSCSQRLSIATRRSANMREINSIRGIEGDSARVYFSIFKHLILKNKSSFDFNNRSRRPPLDRMNSLLSFLYTLLLQDCRSALEANGLHPWATYIATDQVDLVLRLI